MSDPKSSHGGQTRKAGAYALLGTFAACIVFAIVVIVLGVKLHERNSLLGDTQRQLADAKTDGAKAQQDLVKANAASADLKSQLDKANSKAADLQLQGDLAKSAQSEVQAQLDRGKAMTADLQAQLEKSKAQSADLQNQVNQSNAGSTQLLTQLDQAKIQSMDMQARLQKAENDIAQLQPMLLKTRHMPVTTSFEKEHWGQGFVLHVNNLNRQPLSVSITVMGPGNARSQANVIGAAETLNVDKLSLGDAVTLSSDGYDTVNLAVK